MRKKRNKVCTSLDYIENVLIITSMVKGCVSVSSFSLFVGIPRSEVGLKICAITSGIKKYKLNNN